MAGVQQLMLSNSALRSGSQWQHSPLRVRSRAAKIPVPFLGNSRPWRVYGESKSIPIATKATSLSVRATLNQVDVSKVVPQTDRVLFRLEDMSEKSSGGVLLPKSAVKFERYLVGEVLSVGSQVEGVEKGSKFIFSDVNAYEVDLGTPEKLCFVRSGDLLATVE